MSKKTMPMASPPPRRKRRKRTKRLYFTKVHEDAIIKYAQTEDPMVRAQLYEEYIQPAFSEMVDKIVFTYKFTNLPNSEALREECKIWLTTIIGKYDPTKGSKAFSYFSVITKNWFIHKVKKNSRKLKREVEIETISKAREMEYLSLEPEYHKTREKEEFWIHFWKEIDSWDTGNLKPNEKKVLEAIKILLESSEDIEIFNMKL